MDRSFSASAMIAASTCLLLNIARNAITHTSAPKFVKSEANSAIKQSANPDHCQPSMQHYKYNFMQEEIWEEK